MNFARASRSIDASVIASQTASNAGYREIARRSSPIGAISAYGSRSTRRLTPAVPIEAPRVGNPGRRAEICARALFVLTISKGLAANLSGADVRPDLDPCQERAGAA